MLPNVLLYIILSAAGSCALSKFRYQSLVSLLFFFTTSAIFAHFITFISNGGEAYWSYNWLQTQYYSLVVFFDTKAEYLYFIAPVFIITTISLLYNAFYPLEKQKAVANALNLLNLACFIALICSQNLVQLLVCSSLINFIAFYIISDLEAKKRFVFYNLLADMGLFMLFAVIYGQLNTINIDSLADYKRIGHHKDWVIIILLICVFIKSALFMFQNSLLDARNIGFNRLIIVSYCSTPVVGVIILYKLRHLLAISEISVPMIQFFAILSIIWGVVGAGVIDNIKSKSIYLSTSLCALLYALLSISANGFDKAFASLVLIGFAISSLFIMLVIAASNENMVSKMGRFIEKLKFSFLIVLTTVFAAIVVLSNLITTDNFYWICGLGASLILVLSHIFYQIYFCRTEVDDRVWALLKTPNVAYWMPVLLLSCFLIYITPEHSTYLAVVMVGFLILTIIPPLKKLDRLYYNEKVQHIDLIHRFYELVIITPIKVLGRVLWLLIDFMFIERSFIGFLHKLMSIILAAWGRFNKETTLNRLFWAALGVGVLLLSLKGVQ